MTENDNELPSYSFWNHRVIKREHDLGGEKVFTYGIHEVYYSADGETPSTFTLEAVPIHGESIEELQHVLKWMQDAIAKPVLNYKDFFNERTDTN